MSLTTCVVARCDRAACDAQLITEAEYTVDASIEAEAAGWSVDWSVDIVLCPAHAEATS